MVELHFQKPFMTEENQHRCASPIKNVREKVKHDLCHYVLKTMLNLIFGFNIAE